MLIRISVQEINPFELVFIRVGIAAVGLMALVLIRRMPLPKTFRQLYPLILIGIGNTAIPFLMISWGETIIESSVASILQSTASLFTLVIAHFAFEDERMTPQRISGMIAGFIGVVVLFGVNLEEGQLQLSGILGQLAIVGASLFYAIFTTYSRTVLRGTGTPPMVVAAISMSSATVVMGIVTVLSPYFGGASPVWFQNISSGAAISAIVLGVLNTFIAYALFYFVIGALGAARAAMVTYIVPVIGLILGVMFLNETLSANLVIGAALILGGIGIVNLPRRQKSAPQDEAQLVHKTP